MKRTMRWNAAGTLVTIGLLIAIPDLALAQASPFLTGANSIQTNVLAWLTPVAIILVMVLGGMAMANRMSWGWCRERLKNSLSRVNHKRVYRLMSQNGMLLQRYTGKPSGRVHDGKIITIRPNLRWTSDGFEIACWNSQVVRVAFALDTCDREVIGLARQHRRRHRGDNPRTDARERRAALRVQRCAAPGAVALGQRQLLSGA
jgi:TrbC/VIRB2 pilin